MAVTLQVQFMNAQIKIKKASVIKNWAKRSDDAPIASPCPLA